MPNLYIKLNTEKTEFIISGKSSITKNTIQINGFSLHLKNKLKHLGFLWDNQNNTKNIATLQSLNVNERIIQFQSISRALIKSGIRFCQPLTIVHLFKSLAIPNLLYGLEICCYNNSLLNKLDAVGRSALKLAEIQQKLPAFLL